MEKTRVENLVQLSFYTEGDLSYHTQSILDWKFHLFCDWDSAESFHNYTASSFSAFEIENLK
jgi:hypothetical protein